MYKPHTRQAITTIPYSIKGMLSVVMMSQKTEQRHISPSENVHTTSTARLRAFPFAWQQNKEDGNSVSIYRLNNENKYTKVTELNRKIVGCRTSDIIAGLRMTKRSLGQA